MTTNTVIKHKSCNIPPVPITVNQSVVLITKPLHSEQVYRKVECEISIDDSLACLSKPKYIQFIRFDTYTFANIGKWL